MDKSLFAIIYTLTFLYTFVVAVPSGNAVEALFAIVMLLSMLIGGWAMAGTPWFPSPKKKPLTSAKPLPQSYQRHRKLRENGGSHTAREWNELCARYKHRCLACGHKRPLTKDHVLPVYLGGGDSIANIQPLCGSCNSRKHTQHIDYRKKRKEMSCDQ